MFKQLLLLLAGLMFGMSASAAGNQYTLGVKGVACPYCAYGVEKRLNKVDGVENVSVDIGDNVVRVTMAEGATLTKAKARTAVDEAGFTLHSFSQAQAKQGKSDEQ
ncbi:heavy-metal-associated domain-containing protein [Salinisphaera sp. P385]|uniref:Heavy-metal-associated domain-containing protein n=1 Tax=Spectribacter acetivorans TaxID=3075603 RepID=A0ABU3B868_9GAMM|nr:heavy-metal-associated domain-containing protein [Salinisphaera sp. P385]MDT0617488.1 heavy-metal-associated domain-containing protein [Salinisphaera sp. P385]